MSNAMGYLAEQNNVPVEQALEKFLQDNFGISEEPNPSFDSIGSGVSGSASPIQSEITTAQDRSMSTAQIDMKDTAFNRMVNEGTLDIIDIATFDKRMDQLVDGTFLFETGSIDDTDTRSSISGATGSGQIVPMEARRAVRSIKNLKIPLTPAMEEILALSGPKDDPDKHLKKGGKHWEDARNIIASMSIEEQRSLALNRYTEIAKDDKIAKWIRGDTDAGIAMYLEVYHTNKDDISASRMLELREILSGTGITNPGSPLS
jgi:hypothetical protein